MAAKAVDDRVELPADGKYIGAAGGDAYLGPRAQGGTGGEGEGAVGGERRVGAEAQGAGKVAATHQGKDIAARNVDRQVSGDRGVQGYGAGFEINRTGAVHGQAGGIKVNAVVEGDVFRGAGCRKRYIIIDDILIAPQRIEDHVAVRGVQIDDLPASRYVEDVFAAVGITAHLFQIYAAAGGRGRGRGYGS